MKDPREPLDISEVKLKQVLGRPRSHRLRTLLPVVREVNSPLVHDRGSLY